MKIPAYIYIHSPSFDTHKYCQISPCNQLEGLIFLSSPQCCSDILLGLLQVTRCCWLSKKWKSQKGILLFISLNYRLIQVVFAAVLEDPDNLCWLNDFSGLSQTTYNSIRKEKTMHLFQNLPIFLLSQLRCIRWAVH